jgi:hypothetical protein
MRDDRPPGDPWNNPEDRKAWEQQGWVIERETAFKKTPENGWIDLTQPLPDEPPPLSEEHQRQVCRLLDNPLRARGERAHEGVRALEAPQQGGDGRGGPQAVRLNRSALPSAGKAVSNPGFPARLSAAGARARTAGACQGRMVFGEAQW